LCETDFVAKNENFHALFDQIMDKICTITSEVAGLQDIDTSLLDEINSMINEFI